MVQQDIQATSDAEANAASPADSGDQPLIADEQPARPSWEINSEQAGHVDEQQGAGEESVGDAEQPGEGAADAEVIEVWDTEEEAEGEGEGDGGARQRSDEEFRKLQSAYDRQVAARDQYIQQLQQRTSQEAFQAQVQAVENQWARGLVESQGLADQDAQAIAQQYSQMAARAYQTEQIAQQLAAAMQQASGQTEYTARSVVARDLAIKHGVSEEDRALLLGYNDPQTMEQAARRLGQLNKNRQDAARRREAEVPAGGPEQQYDGGYGASGLTDDQKLADPNTPVAELQRILSARGQSPL